MLAKFTISFVLCLITFYTKADIYEFINEDGQVVYSDNPSDDRYVLVIKEEQLIVTAQNSNVTNTTEIATDELKVRSSFITTPTELLDRIDVASKTHKVDPDLIHAVIHVESLYKQHAHSVKGAIGLMQLMPATAKRMGVTDIYNPTQNINGGTKYLRLLLTMFDNDLRLALAAYNAGEKSVIRFGKKIPPFKETQDYVSKVMQVYEALQRQRAKMTPA